MPHATILPRTTLRAPALVACLALLPAIAGAAPSGGVIAPITGIARVVGGSGHTCATATGGTMLCWGDNVYAQVGDGTSEERWTAVPVIGLGGLAQTAAAGGSHTCASSTTGAARCWAYNWFGQVGDGTDTDRDLPTPVLGLGSGVQAIVTGMIHSCALVGGGVKCWGANGFGQLGDGSDTQRLAPVQVSGLASGVQAIAAGGEHTCALTTGGGVKCWGANDYGQLGNNSTNTQHAPVNVSGLASGVVAISAGRFHTCAVTSGGGAKCWGANENGELGDGTQAERHVPVDVSGLASGVASIAAGQGHTCARTSGGGVKCWGSNSWGQLGDGSGSDRLTPVDVSGLASGATSIGVGSDHSCAVASAGRVLCWGSNQYG
ncbi:MAG TPA: hypothetical protein VIZ64_10785, partial [Dokdonella sp.]